MNNKLDLARTRAALPGWRMEDIRLDVMLRAAKTNEDVEAWRKAEKENDERLRRAFLEDTKDRNNWSQVCHASVSWIIEMAEKDIPA